jgi:hypothetical protein
MPFEAMACKTSDTALGIIVFMAAITIRFNLQEYSYQYILSNVNPLNFINISGILKGTFLVRFKLYSDRPQ